MDSFHPEEVQGPSLTQRVMIEGPSLTQRVMIESTDRSRTAADLNLVGGDNSLKPLARSDW